MLLALDTATRLSGIALLDGQTLLAELNWTSQDSQTVELLPRLSQLLAWHGVAPSQLQAIAVSLGPGSFTGLRVALSAAKGMALAHGLPLIGVPTLDAAALPLVAAGQPVCALLPAGRGRVYWARYAAVPSDDLAAPVILGGWRGWRTAYRLNNAGELASAVQQPVVLAGELPPPLLEALGPLLAGQGVVAPPVAATRRAAAVGELGWQRWQAGQLADPASLAPIYLQEP